MQPKMESLLVCGDAHIPFEDKRAWALMLSVGRWLKPHHVVCVGDIADCMAVSSHSKDPIRKTQFKQEVAAVNHALDELDALKGANYVFVAGNHCDRLTRYLQDVAPELYGVVDIPALFKLNARAWNYVPYKQYTKLGKLYITHDVGSAGRFAAFKALDTFQHSIVTGHTHRLCYIVEGNAVGEFKLSAQFGWLGDASKVDYMARVNVNKNWALGFGVGYLNPATGVAYLVPVPIVVVKGVYSCVVNGKYFEG